ncbi:MAG: glycosyltransferase, partial [Planctomycetia bacterium]|nr:glycosyltransferase [Planctomycetia bacterium]
IKKGKYILSLGRLVQEKKIDVLIDAFMHSGILGYQLIIAGDDPNEEKYIKSLHDKAKESSNIIFTGVVYGDDKESLLQKCQAFCIPSELEGLPITLLEAMSYGKVCIASDIEANKEALGNSGIYFKLNDKKELSKCLNSVVSGDFIHLGLLSKKRIEKLFTWDNIAEQFDEYYNMVINNYN